METIGVMAVVEGLSSFTSDMGKVESAISGIVPPASILQDAFGALGKAAGDFASWVGDVLTIALGNLLADAIQGVVALMQELIDKTIAAGNEFQVLTLRLNGMNLNDLIESGVGYNDAMTQSVEMTKEQLFWLQKLAAATPFDNTDISAAYSLARSYGFADQEARDLTESTSDFTSAMGLSGDTIERILRNFGQMKARGKITGSELRDLARGAFLPLDDVLGRVAKSMGITTKELNSMISTKEGVDFQPFIDAFSQMVAEEPRFTGASERMARTFKASTDNVKDLASSFGGLNIVMPILDVLGGKIADFMDQFIKSDDAGQTFTDLGQRFLDASVKIGEALSGIVNDVLGLLPSTDVMAEGLVGGVEWVANWLTDNKDDIVSGVQDIWNKMKEWWDWIWSLGTPKLFSEGGIKDDITGLFNDLKDLYDQLFTNPNDTGMAGGMEPPSKTGWVELKDAIFELGESLSNVVMPILDEIGFTFSENKPTVDDFVSALSGISSWINENRELLETLLKIVIGFIIIQTITNIVMGFLLSLIGLAAGVIAVVAAVGFLSIAFSVVSGIVLAVIGVFKLAQIHFSNVVIGIQFGIDLIVGYFRNMEKTITNIWTEINNAGRRQDWAGVGLAIIQGLARGISSNISMVITAARDAAMAAYNAAMKALWAHSPSLLFAGVGENMMLGMAEGISESASVAVRAMQGAVAAVTMPAMSAPSITQQYTQAPKTISNTYQSNNQYNLAINSNANSEQVAADFNMMQSLAGI